MQGDTHDVLEGSEPRDHICYAALWRLQMRESSGERTSGGNGLSDFVDLGHKSCSAVKQR